MAEKLTKVETFQVHYICDTCNTGTMQPTGEVLTSYPAKYPHVCNHCKEKKNFLKTYPYITHKEVEG